MKKQIYFLIIILFLISSSVSAQENYAAISGTVNNSFNKNFLEGVNIFISGTLLGASTDRAGYFEIKNIPPGNHQLVVSMIGFKTIMKTVSVKRNTNYSLNFSLDEKPIEIDSITITAEIPEEWFEQLEIFKEKFLGYNDFAEKCIIENETELNFENDQNGNFIASCDNPVIVINKALGYKIHIVLQSFIYNKTEGEINYVIQPFFEDYIDSLNIDKQSIKENRRNSYLGSFTHFLKSFVNKTFTKEKFYYIPQRAPGKSIYYRVKDNYDEIVAPTVDEGIYEVHFANYLQVVYDRGKYTSWIKMFQPFILVDKYGYTLQVPAFTLLGDWADFGVAKLFPRYVDFEKEEK